MKNDHFIKNSKGMTLVEIMVAVAVSGGLALTVAKLIENSAQNTKQIEAKTENINLKGIIQNNLSTPDACKNTFNPLITQANLTTLSSAPTAQVSVPNIKDKTNSSIYSTSSTNIRPLTITSINLTNYNSAAGTGDLVIKSNFLRSSSTTQEVKPIVIPINFNIDNSNPAAPDLRSCSTMAVGGGEWLKAGNAGTVDGTDYIGTSDNVPLNFRVNAQPSGRIDSTGLAFFGYLAGQTSDPNTYNTGFGFNALTNLTSALHNTAIGYMTLSTLTTTGAGAIKSGSNTAVGSHALRLKSTGGSNTAVGRNAQELNTSGYSNTCVGAFCMNNLSTGTSNVALGNNALRGDSVSGFTGNENIALGANAGMVITTATNNTILGNYAGSILTTGSRNILIGHSAGASYTTENDRLFIDSSGAATPLIGGNFSSREVHLNGNVGIGTTTPGTPSTTGVATAGVTKLHVTGGKTILDQEDWITLTPGITYFKDSSGIVHLRGSIMNASSPGPNILLGTLPVGYRPGQNIHIPVVIYASPGFLTNAPIMGSARIRSNGELHTFGHAASDQIFFDSISFATH